MAERAPAAAARRLALLLLLRRLTGLATRSRKARELSMELEHQLMRITGAGGLRAAERAIASLNGRDRHLVLIEKRTSLRAWRDELAGGRRTLEIRLVANRLFRSALVRYTFVRKTRLTPRQRRIHAMQEAFYSRYMTVEQKAYRDARHRLAPDDRLVLLIGELEADVNNGGFSQFVDNKGRRRARAAVAALRAVGARKTATMLETALAPDTTPTTLSALDASTPCRRTSRCSRRATWGCGRNRAWFVTTRRAPSRYARARRSCRRRPLPNATRRRRDSRGRCRWAADP